MDTFRKWLNKPKADDKSLLARFYHADRSLTAVASELDSFDGRAEPDRCSRLVSRLRQGQDKVLSITNLIMEELLGEERDPRAFRAKFPEEVLQENLGGQLWFGAECLAAGSSIMNREQESKEMRPLAQAVTKSLGNVRNLLRDQCLRNNVPNSKTLRLDTNDSATEQLYESLKIFDRLFAEFELRYVSAMVQVKTKHEYEMQEFICVLFSETLQRALKIGLVDQDKVDAFDPALMFSIPRLAIIAGLVVFPKGPLNMEMSAEQLSEMFRPFRTILIKIRDLLKALSQNELLQLEKLLCTNEDIHLKIPAGTSSIEAPTPDQENNNTNTDCVGVSVADANVANPTNLTNSVTVNENCNSGNNNNNNNNNNTTTTNPTTTNQTSVHATVEPQTPSTSPNKTFKAASASTTENIYTPRYAARSPSISSISVDSSPATTPASTPSASPSPSRSIVSSSSAATSTTSAADWSDDDEEDIDEDDVDDELRKELEELDIVSADCASGYLIPNTNFGNLLQPQEVPLTDNFIASEDEFGSHQHLEDADMPTTSAAVSAVHQSLKRLHLHKQSDDEPELEPEDDEPENMKPSEESGSLSEKTPPTTSKQSCPSNGSSATCSSASHRQHSCTNSNGSIDASRPHHHHHHHHHNHSHGHQHHHSHHHHHHHHHNRSRGHHSKSKRCSLDGCQSEEVITAKKEEETPTTTTTVTPSTPTAVHKDTSSVDSSASSSLSDGVPHEVSLELRAANRTRFKNTENLLHRLFVCTAGVADQLQTNFASDLRQILRSVFLMNMSPTQEEIDIPEKTKDSELFEFRASENDVIQESAGSNQSIYSAEEVNPEVDNVFNNTTSSSSSSNSSGGGVRYSAGSTIQRGNTIDLGANNTTPTAPTVVRNHVERSRSLGDQDNNEITTAVMHTNSRRLSTYISGRQVNSTPRQLNGNAHHHQRSRNNSVGSNSPSSSSSESNSPMSERECITHGRHATNNNNSNNINNNSNNNNSLNALNSAAMSTQSTNTASVRHTRLSPPAWIPDDKAPRCMSCHTHFTAFRRRHHCRNCGGVFCGVCSNASAPLPKYGLTKAVRVCRECYVREVLTTATVVNAGRNNATSHMHDTATTAAAS